MYMQIVLRSVRVAELPPFGEATAYSVASRKQVRVTNTALHPTLYSEAGVYRGIFFLIFAPKHRLWVLVRTASLRRF